jgi:signal transduction histidine kinase
MIRPRSIFFRHLLSNLLVILVLLLTMAGLLIYVIYNGNGPPALHKRVSEVADFFAATTEIKQITDTQTWQLINKASNATMWLTDINGNVLGGVPPEGLTADRLPRTGLPASAQKVTLRPLHHTVIIAVPTNIAGTPAILYAYQDIRNFRTTTFGRLIFWTPFLVGILAAIVLGFLVSRSLTKSIANIASAAAHFASGDRSSRTTAVGNDELGDLGRNFNAMADSISRSEETRREFYSNVSHELKTPLSCIQAITEALVDGIAKTPDDYQLYLQKINSETLRMSRMLRDLLDMEQLEVGKLHIRQDRVDMHALLSKEADKIQDLLKAKSLSLVLRLETDRRYIKGDADRLTQVFDNLLSNAIRHTAPSSIISIIMTEEDSKLKIAVSDQGEGIDAKDLPLIWERFYRIDKSRDRAAGGSGLGLPITRSLVEAMGGTIAVHSVKNQGTTFIIEFSLI